MENNNDISHKSPTTRGKALGSTRSRSLRPPTLMIDLLFGALMLFAFQMGYVDQPVVPKDIELPATKADVKSKTKEILALVPVKNRAGSWEYRAPSGKILSAKAVQKEVAKNNKTPVLIFSKKTSLQVYLEAEQQLRELGLKPGLATNNKKGT